MKEKNYLSDDMCMFWLMHRHTDCSHKTAILGIGRVWLYMSSDA